jgi:hypothetical protein
MIQVQNEKKKKKKKKKQQQQGHGVEWQRERTNRGREWG